MSEIREINLLKDNILANNPRATTGSISLIDNTTPFLVDPNSNKRSFSEYTPERREMAVQKLSDGTYIDRYDNYIPGVDNQQLNALSQTSSEKWLNGIAKFGGKTFNAVIGGTAGIFYGVGKMAEDGSLTSLYDNDFTKTLDDWNTKLDYNLPNYYTKQEQSQGLGGQLLTANFWSDKVLGGLSFTAGALVSEGIWAWATGGASIGSAAARLGARAPWATRALGFEKVALGLNRTKNLIKEPLLKAYQADKIAKNTAIALGKTGDLLNTTRFMLTSAGYEASVEALQFKKEQQEKFYNNFQELNGRTPTAEEARNFEDELADTSNAVFGVNYGIVGMSNLATMGNIVGLKNPIKTGISDFLEKKAFGKGITSTVVDGKTIFAPIQATITQRVAGKLFAYGKAPIVEGIYEEGLQGVTQKTAGKWLDHGYNPLYASENTELSGLIYESLAEQYGTKQGWVENGVGLIIGALGGSVNARAGEINEQAEQEYKISGLNSYTEKVLNERFLMANRVSGFSQEAEQESQSGNVIASKIATDGVLHARINHAYQLGEDLNTLTVDAKTALDSMSPQQFVEAGILPDQIDSYKTEVLAEYQNSINQFKTNRKFAEYTIGRGRIAGVDEVLATGAEEFGTKSREGLVQALTWNLTAGDNALNLINDAREQISQEVGAEQSRVINTVQQLQNQEAFIQNQTITLTNQYDALTQERDNLQRSIIEDQNSNREAGAEVGQKNIRLLELNQEISTIQDSLQTTVNDINNQNSYKGTLGQLSNSLTVDNLLNLTKDETNFDNFLKSYATANPQRYQYVEGLIDEYNKGLAIYNSHKKTTQMFTEGKVNINQTNSWLGKQLTRKSTMDEVTRDWLIEVLQNYQANKVMSAAETLSQDLITDQIYDVFTQTGEVGEDIINALADKVIAQTPLTERESEIFNEKRVEITNRISQTPTEQAAQAISEVILSPAEELRKRLENLLKRDYYSMSYIGTDYDEVLLKKPTPSEVEEYRNLRESGEQSERLDFLQEKLSNWRLLDSAVIGDNQTIVDLIDLIEQLETTVENKNTVDELTPEDIANISQADKGGVTSTTVRYDLAQNTKGSVTVQIISGKGYKFSHLKMTTILDALNIPLERAKVLINNKPVKNLKRANFENYAPGTVFYLDNLKFTIGAGNTIEMSRDTYNAIKDVVDMNIIIPSVNWSYFDVYERNGRKKPSDFQENINPQELYNVRSGDILSLRISQDSYNESLRDKSLEEIEKNLKIEIVSKGQAVSTLKATGSTVAPAEEFLMLRKAAAQAFIKGESLNAKITAKGIFLGSPQITTENLTPVNVEIPAGKVISTGYFQNGELKLSRELGEVNMTYVLGLRNDPNLKLPVVVFKKGVYSIAYPVTLVKSPAPMTERITGILNNILLSEVEKVKAVNQQIIETGIAPELRLSKFDPIQIQNIIDAFAQNETFVSMDNFASTNYRIANVTSDAQINIDLNNLDQTISDPKLELDLQSITVSLQANDRYENLIDIEDKLSSDAIELYQDYIRNADSKYLNSRGEIIEDTTYTNAFDDNVVTAVPTSNIEKLSNVRILREAFSGTMPKSLQDIIGKDKITEIKNLLRKYDMLKSQTTPNREVAQEIIEENTCG